MLPGPSAGAVPMTAPADDAETTSDVVPALPAPADDAETTSDGVGRRRFADGRRIRAHPLLRAARTSSRSNPDTRIPGYTVGIMLKDLTTLHRALADETRLRALHLLLELGELCVCDVETALDVSQSKASRHLVTLKQAGLVGDRRDGTWVYYRIAGDLDGPSRAALESLSASLRADDVGASDVERARRLRRSPRCEAPDAGSGARR